VKRSQLRDDAGAFERFFDAVLDQDEDLRRGAQPDAAKQLARRFAELIPMFVAAADELATLIESRDEHQLRRAQAIVAEVPHLLQLLPQAARRTERSKAGIAGAVQKRRDAAEWKLRIFDAALGYLRQGKQLKWIKATLAEEAGVSERSAADFVRELRAARRASTLPEFRSRLRADVALPVR
jgi:hypothetical protein